MNENQAPPESRKAVKLWNKLYKTEKEQQIFLGFWVLKQEQKETNNKAKYFWIFEYQTEIRTKQASTKT